MPPQTNAKRRRKRRSGPAPGSAYLSAVPAVAGVEGRSARRRRKNRESKARKGEIEAGIRPARTRLPPPIVAADEAGEVEAPGWRRGLTGGDEGGVVRQGLGEQGDRISPSRPVVPPRTLEEVPPRPAQSPIASTLSSTPTPAPAPEGTQLDDRATPAELEQQAGPSTSPNDTKGKTRAVDFNIDITETLADAEIPARASGSRSGSPNVVIGDTGTGTRARSRSPPSPHTRAVEGWTTRRADRHAEIEEALEILGRGSVEGLPADTLLHSLHAHASRFYVSHGLLLDPSQTRHGPRANLPWRNRKRALLEDAGVLPISASRGFEGSGSRDPGARGRGRGRVGSESKSASRSRSRGLSGATGGHDDGAEAEAEESDERSDDNRRRTRSMSLRRASGPRWKTRATESRSPVKASEADELESERDEREDGVDVPILADAQLGYRRRDMHTAFDGQALLALGVLVEELVAYELEQAGYAPGHEKGRRRKRKRMSAAGEGERDGSPRPMASRC